MGRARKWQWPRVRHAYITGQLGYHALCEKYGIPYGTLSKVARNEGWAADRKKYRSDVAQEALERARAREVDHLEALRESADSLAGAVQRITAAEDQLYMHTGIVRDSDGAETIEETRLSAINSKTLRDLAASVRELTQAMRNLYGLPTQGEAEAQRIAAERLKLDKQRAEAEEPDREIRIVMDERAEEASG